MKIMVAFLGKKKNRRNEYLEQIKRIHKNNILSDKIKNKSKEYLIRNNRKCRDDIINLNCSDLRKHLSSNKSIEKNLNFDSGYTKFNIIKDEKEDTAFFNSFKLTLVFCLGLMFLIYKYPNIKLELINFATNFRQADHINVEISDIVTTASLFDEDNYILTDDGNTDENISTQEIAENESNEYKIIDEQVEKYNLEQVFANQDINVNINSETATLQKISVNDIWILNYSSNRNIDFESIMSKDINLTKKSDKILLYNTHTSESYTNSDKYQFEYSSVMRSLDAKYNMLGIAKELNENLTKKGFISVQDTTPHDYGAYTGAYTKSRQTVVNALESMGGAGIIIDVHRDAMADLTYRPVANVNGVQVSQLMFVVGIGTGENEYWEENLKLALKLQEIANKVYPGLFRQMIIRNSTYNQDLNKYSLLIEFGATGNTIDEVKLSTRCVANLLNILYKD